MAAVLFLARIAYAFSWYNIGAVLPLIGGRFGAGPDALGFVLGAFLAGAGLFQVPAGFAAIRWGNRNSSIFGLLLMGGAGVLSAFSPDLFLLAITRFAAGVGAAFFFAPGLSLISSYYRAGERGPAIGLYNGAFNVGAAAGLVGGAFVGEALGWSAALLVGGAAILLAGGGVALLIPPELPRDRPRTRSALWFAGRGVLRSRSVWALAAGLIGFWAVVNVVGLYFVEFAQSARPGWGLGTAAAVAAAVVLISGIGGPVGGWLAERSRDRRTLVAAFASLTALLVVSIPFLPLGPLIPLLLVLGVADGIVFAVQYLMPTYFPESSGDGAALAVGLINSVQVLVGSGLTILFGLVAQAQGFTTAWLLSGLLGLGLLPLLLLIPQSHARPPPATVVPASRA
ncbi:MAG: MFS transporter [Thermoplasmata archaeon]|nr:MFS transporter [Thermoplasmata archaeon]